jgi:flavin reductase (DIM6/NTAB) family NADH-FMN oxidoreductase RutF
VAAAGLTPVPASQVAAPAFEQAELIIECRKIYHDVFHPKNFLSNDIEGNYNGSNYHSIYFGEILAIQGVGRYIKGQE